MKVHDQLEFADLQNLASAPASPTVGRIYFDTVLGAFRYWDGAAWRSIANIAQAQTLTNKTLTSPVISQISNTGTITLPTATDTLVGRATTDTLSNKTFSDAPNLSAGGLFAQIATPVSPSSGFNKIYPKSDGYFYSQDSTGAERKIGSGAGGIEYIQNTDFESGIANFTTYANAAATPTTGSGGVPTLTLVKSTTTPLRGTASGLLTPGALGDGVATTIAIDKADQAKMLTVSFDYQVVSGTLADGDYTVWAYDVTNSLLIQLAPYKVLGNLGFGKFQGTFQSSYNSTSYRILIHQAVASTATLRIDNVSCQPIVKLFGAPVTDWQAYVPTLTGFGTPSSVSFQYRRVGDSVQIQGTFTSGTSTAVQAQVTLPPGLVADSVKISALTLVGYGSVNSASTDQWQVYTNSSNSYLTFGRQGSSAGLTQLNGSSVISAGSIMSFSALVPIQGWGSSVVMSQDADTRVCAARYHVSANYAYTSPNPINFDAADFDTHGAVTTGASTWKFTAPIPGFYHLDTMVNSTTGVTGYMSVFKNGAQFCDLSYQFTGTTIWLGATLLKLNAGDTIQLVLPTNCTLGVATFDTWICISKLSGPAAIAASESVSARAYQTSAQSAFSALTVIALDTKDFDTHGGLTLGAGSRYTAQAPGKYRLSWTVTSGNVAWTVGQAFIVMPYKNGAQSPGLPQDTCIAMGSGTYRQTSRGSITLNLLAGDYVDLRATSDVSQAPLTAGTWMGVERIGN